MLEAERQKTAHGRMEDWAVQFSQLVEDDVFATFVQVLHLPYSKSINVLFEKSHYIGT